MRIAVLTIFPEMFDPFWGHGIIRRAIAGGVIDAQAIDIRDFAAGRHRSTDDAPYGGGSGMVMRPEPLAAAIREARRRIPGGRCVLMTPQGRVFGQPRAREFAALEGLILVCGRYEGVDDRLCPGLIDEELSIGDYVLTGGEVPAMVVIDAVTRLIPGALGAADSAERESFAGGRLEHAHYTRPAEFEGLPVPAVLRSGHHREIDRWRLESALMRTFVNRRDLLAARPLSAEEADILRRWRREIDALLAEAAGGD
jgi:tRNA (guanine37-N1)-methyltransferase